MDAMSDIPIGSIRGYTLGNNFERNLLKALKNDLAAAKTDIETCILKRIISRIEDGEFAHQQPVEFRPPLIELDGVPSVGNIVSCGACHTHTEVSSLEDRGSEPGFRLRCGHRNGYCSTHRRLVQDVTDTSGEIHRMCPACDDSPDDGVPAFYR